MTIGIRPDDFKPCDHLPDYYEPNRMSWLCKCPQRQEQEREFPRILNITWVETNDLKRNCASIASASFPLLLRYGIDIYTYIHSSTSFLFVVNKQAHLFLIFLIFCKEYNLTKILNRVNRLWTNEIKCKKPVLDEQNWRKIANKPITSELAESCEPTDRSESFAWHICILRPEIE